MTFYGRIAAAAAALIMVGACGGPEENAGQPTADEREKLDNIATKLDDEQTFDTSADSLIPADNPGINAAQTPVASNTTSDGTDMGYDPTQINSIGR